MKKKTRVVLALATLLIVVAAALLFFHRKPGTEGIRVSGNIEATEVQVSFKVSGKVDKRLVDEGQPVSEGQVVAVLESSDLKSEVGLRRAELDASKAALAQLEAGSRPEEIAQAAAALRGAKAALDEMQAGSRPQEVEAARAAVAQARAETDRLDRDYERYSRLKEQKAVAVRDYDATRTARDAARAKLKESMERYALVREGPRREEIDRTRAALDEARERLAVVKAGSRREEIDQGRARTAQAREALALAETRLAYATVVSPLTGMVLSKNIEPGEFVSAGTPILTVADLVNVWLRAYVVETDLGRVRLNSHARVTADTWPGRVYEGRISFISSQAEFTPKSVQTDKERVKLVYRVKIDINNPSMELKPGMPADAEILRPESVK